MPTEYKPEHGYLSDNNFKALVDTLRNAYGLRKGGFAHILTRSRDDADALIFDVKNHGFDDWGIADTNITFTQKVLKGGERVPRSIKLDMKEALPDNDDLVPFAQLYICAQHFELEYAGEHKGEVIEITSTNPEELGEVIDLLYMHGSEPSRVFSEVLNAFKLHCIEPAEVNRGDLDL
jgi:hypothetical protein